MDIGTLAYPAVALKLGATGLGAIVLFVLVAISRPRHRARPAELDDAIVGRMGRSSAAPGRDRGGVDGFCRQMLA